MNHANPQKDGVSVNAFAKQHLVKGREREFFRASLGSGPRSLLRTQGCAAKTWVGGSLGAARADPRPHAAGKGKGRGEIIVTPSFFI